MFDAFDQYTAHPPNDFDHFDAPTEGFVGVFEQLVSEHRQVAHVISRLFQEQGSERAAVWNTLRRNLLVHEYAEQHAVYAALDNYPSLQVMLDDHTDDVPPLETLILQLDAFPVDTEEWELTLHRLEAMINDHVQREEVELFPRVQDVLGTARALELARVYVAAKALLLEGGNIGTAREALKNSTRSAAATRSA
jgi:hypothetical protein